MRLLFALIAGGFFGSGLYLSGMTDTAKVIGWLDLFGDWDPTLAFVMGGAIVPMAAAWAYSRQRVPILGGTFPPRASAKIDRRLAIGSVFFGVGWGLVGLCPGPVIASISYATSSHFIFLAAMIAGMLVAPRLTIWLDSTRSAE